MKHSICRNHRGAQCGPKTPLTTIRIWRASISARSFAQSTDPSRERRSPDERAATLVLDPTREGQQQLTHAIRLALVRDGTLAQESMVDAVLELVGLNPRQGPQSRQLSAGADRYLPQRCRQGAAASGVGYRVDAVDGHAGTVRLLGPKDKPLTWSSAASGGDQAESFVEVEQELRTGDRIQFTRNNYAARRSNGHTATVGVLDAATGTMLFERQQDGQLQQLDLKHLADRHIRPGWVQTIHAVQGATCERVMAYLEAFRSYVDADLAYVAVSRAKASIIYTDDHERLASAIEGRSSGKVGAIDETLMRKGAAITIPTPVRTMGVAIG